MAHTEVKVDKFPDCDICKAAVSTGKQNVVGKAKYDGKTNYGPWAYMCTFHFSLFGVGLGQGKGQRLTEK